MLCVQLQFHQQAPTCQRDTAKIRLKQGDIDGRNNIKTEKRVTLWLECIWILKVCMYVSRIHHCSLWLECIWILKVCVSVSRIHHCSSHLLPCVAGIYFDVTEIQPLVQGVFRFDQNGQQVLLLIAFVDCFQSVVADSPCCHVIVQE